MRALVVIALLAFPLACGGTQGAGAAKVAQVLDGDTITLEDGRHVRLVQLDAPETDEGECYAREAERFLARLLPLGTEVEIETDPALDQRDRFGRILAYVRKDGANINLELVRRGAAAPWFYEGDRGRYAGEFLAAAREARSRRRGLWGACPGTVLDPTHSIEARN
jgi:endonuclease YncB( thermonuclease family)